MATMLLNAFRPTIDALFTWNLSFSYRWRLLLLQPLSFLIFCIKVLPWSFSRAYAVHWIPTRAGRSIRSIVFRPPPRSHHTESLRPLHLDIHGGSFMGGVPEFDAVFAQMTARRTGAVVVCVTYRFAPVHSFPAAHDDIEDVVRYLHQHAEDKFGADPQLMTISGFSAGGNLALSVSQLPECQPAEPTSVKAILLVYSPVSLSYSVGLNPVSCTKRAA
jgi:acetyl esterase/lipase